MDAHNALKLDASQFGEAAVSEDTKAFNQKLQDIMSKGPKCMSILRARVGSKKTWRVADIGIRCRKMRMIMILTIFRRPCDLPCDCYVVDLS